ncbi:Not CCR4-Not complex component domain-containing protein [Rozella allomycis CSF55]|uniref:General negative regulator of transcription subunit n=1 Tax=Rozella allomycis (strain CSF55) TaxID=988480 RepID=A0A075APH9_ROZAC|nr:Not CCR4-Not complex component domain-containing protein [Rozella allomycis CSF55]|eukprot:EPZ31958.1 Not CCR4-Not complex component domain-containing protein [Rozella allomycis CSF55]
MVYKTGEIDKTLKKVTEGIAVFEEIFDKLYAATTSNQKEKFENDLKREIKKLQRLRDQIKTWIAGTEIKDKTSLLESRRTIETMMEKFKACEREMKTKAYSKEGLNAAVKIDPREKEKSDLCSWINGCVDRLNTQIDAKEAEIEALLLKKQKKSELEKRKELEAKVERYKFHQAKLEHVLRNLENDILTNEQVSGIKDSVEYYLENNEEPDFDEDEEMYEELNMEDEDELNEDDDEPEIKKKPVEVEPSKTPLNNSSSLKPKEPIIRKKSNPPVLIKQTLTPTPVPAPPPPKPNVPYSAMISSKTESNSNETNKVWNKQLPPSLVTPSPTTKIKGIVPRVEKKDEGSPSISESTSIPDSNSSKLTESHLMSHDIQANLKRAQTPVNILSRGSDADGENLNLSFSLLTDYMSTSNRMKPKNDFSMMQNLVDSSFQNIPDVVDSEKSLNYSPKNPVNTPPYYPTQPLPIFENPVLYEKFENDTLFFIFYYQQRTYQQRYLAAKELKRQSWRFHKKYLTWFQRHDEPKLITDEYEQGTYIYFDYEGSWCQRRKSEFTFEYRYLEDAELV